jgi:hypothetical protein
MDSKNTHLILFSAAFLVLGFLLGRVTGHHGPREGHAKDCCAKAGRTGCESHEGHGDFHWVGADDAEVQVMMLTDEEFEGDTVFELPGGGTVNVVRNGDEYEVEVDIEEEMDDLEKHVRVRRERGQDGEVRVEKRVIVVTEED